MKLSKEARRARAQYMRQWRAKNKDKVRRYQKNYWERVAKEQQGA